MSILSVIVPIYNVSKFIKEMIFTLESQTLSKFEVLFIDDGSTDDSVSILKNELILNKPHFQYKIYEKENGGLSDARNYGIERAKFTHIAFLDPDDWLSPDFYETLLSNMVKNKCDIGVSSSIEEWPSYSRPFIYDEDVIETSLNSNCLWVYTWSACTKVFKRALFDEARFDFGIHNEDLAIIPLIISKSRKIYISDKAIYHYRRHSDSILGKQSKKTEYDTFVALENMYSRLSGVGKNTEAKFIITRLLIFSFIPNISNKYNSQDRKIFLQKVLEYLGSKKITTYTLYCFYKENFLSIKMLLISIMFINLPRVSTPIMTKFYNLVKKS
jgi:glycosyltransferase involved in cell wall biosynthesis